MPLVLKGVQSGEDAVLAYQHGLNGIVVSNHGGRNMDTARPALEALIEIMGSLRKANYDPAKFEVWCDMWQLHCGLWSLGLHAAWSWNSLASVDFVSTERTFTK